MDTCNSSHVKHTVTEEQSLRTENQVLKGKVERLTNAVDSVRLLDISDFEENEEVKFYTGLSSTSLVNFACFSSFLIILFAPEKKLRKSKCDSLNRCK